MTAPVFSGFLVTDYRNPHQSPIRFKAWFRDRLLWSLSLPLASICPRKSLVPCCVQLFVTNLWLYGQPLVARSIGRLWWSCLSDSVIWMKQLPNQTSWIDYQPQYRFTVPFFHFFTYLYFPFPSSLWSCPPLLLQFFLFLCALFKHIFFSGVE
mgnify:FL=1